jgi:hypothetical protein
VQLKTSYYSSHISLGGVVRLAGIAEVKVHQAFLRRKTDCQSIGRINIKPSSKGYANDSDVFCTFGKVGHFEFFFFKKNIFFLLHSFSNYSQFMGYQEFFRNFDDYPDFQQKSRGM